MTHDLDRLPPQDRAAEQSVLGACLIDADALTKVVEVLSPDDFYRQAHRDIYTTMLDLFDRAAPVDLVTLAERLTARSLIESVGGASYIASLANAVATSANVLYHARIIRQKSTLRQLARTGTDTVTRALDDSAEPDEVIEQAEAALFAIANRRASGGFLPVRGSVQEAFARMEALYERKEEITGIPSGFTDLDRMTSGFQDADFIVVGGRPSMGKTAFAMNIAEHVALELGKPVGVFSLEMSRAALALRMLSSMTRLDSIRLRNGQIGKDDWPKLTRAAGRLSAAPLFVDDTAKLSTTEIRARARRLKAEHGIELLLIDYFQFISGRNARYDNDVQRFTEISGNIKALAKELNIPVVCLSQLNREVDKRPDKRPNLSDLRETGAIEQDADVVIFPFRPWVYDRQNQAIKNDAELIVAKQRNGPIGTAKAVYIAHCTRFLDAARDSYGFDETETEVF